MGLGLLIVAAGAVAAGFYGYRRLQEIEEEIRSDIAGASAARAKEYEVKEVEFPPGAPPSEKIAVETPPPRSVEISLEERLIEALKENPGILQTVLYEDFPEVNRKVLQQTLLKMDREGVVRRTRAKGSYTLFPG